MLQGYASPFDATVVARLGFGAAGLGAGAGGVAGAGGGRYWMGGGVSGAPGRILYVRLFETERGRIGNWVDAATGELMVAGAEGNVVRMARGTAEPAPEAVEPPVAEEPGAAAADYVGTFALAGPDGGVLTFVLADDSSLRASIDYPDGTPSTVISGTWQANTDGSVTATLTEQDGQTFPPQDIPLFLDTATDELVLAAADGNELRLARAGDEAAAVPTVTTPMTPTVTVTTTEAMTPTCLLYTSPSPRARTRSRMPSSA